MAATVTKSLKTVDEVIDALGGNSAVMTITGVGSPQAVSNWRYRHQIPPRHYSSMLDALTTKGCSAPRGLWGMASPDSLSA